ncbi:acylneuraminate cytidylyltransferase family protein [Arsukibacterium indicum]|uniref:Acylneuraminate cytidylyltransferase family protein n=1 Tax=Arsukibacterium indicum TaxID=2848612 RepID=A0ABS6MGC4_9GAMM|nr:acylneuraminate cytidylyltransferase family protein [Arsukibacterium indicum]MBV2127876.1 acylneuraminate cytidylyltransferase family protein [Arsukibacterium indicum]
MKYIALIPARGGSKGIPDKNIRLVNGQPLITWSIKQAKACPAISRVLVSTDSEKIAEIARAAGAEVPALRPAALAEDCTSTEAVMLHVQQHWLTGAEDEVIVLLQPTSPLRLPDSLANAITCFEQQGADSLVSVCESHAFFWKHPLQPEAQYDFMHRPRRQDIKPQDKQYRENGSIYLTKSAILQQFKNRLGGKIAMFCMQEQESWEIDSLTDLTIVSTLMQESGL